ncbi:MAG TPA: MarR family winged helix-turn-helix transcriptional regulator [Candidatus Binatia bacterium]|jgi:DNA-binding PadR family transcriptional regulator|nr:MarR family winged helix-turn-helix transcriptional regulator [Candidatus Binatia bacterium]
MPIPEIVARLQKEIVNSTEMPIEELRDATWRAARYLLFSLGSGNPDELGQLSSALTEISEGYFSKAPQNVESPREWMRSLAILGQIATGAYESFGPSAEARKALESSEHARSIIGVLVGQDKLQAAELRQLVGIEHQPMVTRLMHTLSKARLVTVERGPGNTAWYRLTPEGRRAAKTIAGSMGKDDNRKPQFASAGASSSRW